MNPSTTLVFWQLFTILYLILFVIAIVSIVKMKIDNRKSFIWILITVFVPLGPFIYFLLGKKQLTETNS